MSAERGLAKFYIGDSELERARWGFSAELTGPVYERLQQTEGRYWVLVTTEDDQLLVTTDESKLKGLLGRLCAMFADTHSFEVDLWVPYDLARLIADDFCPAPQVEAYGL